MAGSIPGLSAQHSRYMLFQPELFTSAGRFSVFRQLEAGRLVFWSVARTTAPTPFASSAGR